MSPRSTPSFFSLGGTLPVDSPSYIARRADEDLLTTLVNREYALVLDSRQKGKSSLLARSSSALNEQGYETIKLDLQRFGSTLTAEQWYATMLFACAEQLKDAKNAKAFWDERPSMGAGEKWIHYLEQRASTSEKGLIVFIDEIDYVRSLPFDTDELFALIRSSFNQRSESKQLEKLSFCFSGASSPAGLVRNPENGQMIMGRRIQLDDFRFEEIAPYASMLGNDEGIGFIVLRKIYAWTNGHPYLTQLACHEWMREADHQRPRRVDEFFSSQLVTVGNQYRSDHLISLSKALLSPMLPGMESSESRDAALQVLRKVLLGKKNRSSELPREVTDYLCITGVIKEQAGRFVMRNKMYSQAFGLAWVMANLPDAEVHLLKQSARRAFITTGLTAATIITALAVLATRNYRLADSLSATLDKSQIREQQALREAYIGGMQSVSADAEDENYMRAGLLIDELSTSQYKDWEWWHTKRKLTGFRLSFPFRKPVVDWLEDTSGKPTVVAHRDEVVILKTGQTIKVNPDRSSVTKSEDHLMIRQSGRTTLIGSDGTISEIEGSVLALRNGRRLVTVLSETGFWIADANGRQVTNRFAFQADSGVLSSDARRCLVRDYRDLRYIDLSTGKVLSTIVQGDAVNAHVLGEAGNFVILATDSPTIVRYSLVTGKPEMSYLGNNGPVRSLALAHSGKWFVSAGADGVVRRFDVASGKLLTEYLGHLNRVQSVTVSEDDKTITSCGFDNSIRKWDVQPATGVTEVNPVDQKVPRLRASEDDRFLLLSEAGFASLIDPKNPTYPIRWQEKTTGPMIAGETLANSSFAAVSADGMFAVVTPNSSEAHRASYPESKVKFLAGPISNGSYWIGFENGMIAVAPSDSRLQLKEIRKPSEPMSALALSPDRRSLALGLRSGKIEFWDTTTAQRTAELEPVKTTVNMVQFSPHGAWLSVATGSGDVLLIATGKDHQIRTLKGHTSRVWRATFSRDGKFLSTCSFDNSARIWNVSTGEEAHNLQHKSWVSDAEFNPSGSRLLTTSGDGSARLWDTVTGREVCVIAKGPSPLFAGRFSSSGRWIMVCASDGRTVLYDGSPF